MKVLTSLIYRITAHGSSRLKPSAYPALAFVANFPPCLQSAAIPSPQAELTTAQLLTYLPKTATIASMMNFLTIFVFTGPYVPFIPKAGVEADLFFPDGLTDPRNRALVAYRKAVIALMKQYAPERRRPGNGRGISRRDGAGGEARALLGRGVQEAREPGERHAQGVGRR